MTAYATYNITNNRLFFWPEKDTRLPENQYKQAKGAGFVWWPRGCFTAIWSPSAEDFITQTMGLEIGEDDSPDDVAARVDRFTRYAANDEKEAESAANRAANANTARRLRLAQGTQERKAAEAAYWQGRIAGAIAHAERKDNPRTISNRIKGIGTDFRRQEKRKKESSAWLTLWETMPSVDFQSVKRLIGNCNPLSYELYSDFSEGKITPEEARTRAINALRYGVKEADRWMEHFAKRLDYERAYLVAVGGSALLEPKEKAPRRVRPTPEDGLKKGMLVEGGFGYNGQNRFTGTILSLGPRNVTMTVPAEHNPYGYYNKGAQVPRKFVKAVPQ